MSLEETMPSKVEDLKDTVELLLQPPRMEFKSIASVFKKFWDAEKCAKLAEELTKE